MEIKEEPKKIYMNNPQLDCYHIAANKTTFVGGRRVGKTHGVVAPWMLRNIEHMPQSAMGIVTPSFKMALTQTMPGTFNALADLGYRRNEHFVIGIRPPKSLGFAVPFREPANYDRVISWYNGSLQYLISQDIPGTSNSLTLQSVFGDEAKYLNFDKLKEETFPANGGFKGPWAGCPWLNSTLFVSDMPTTKKGSWFLADEQKMIPEIIDGIRVILSEIYRFSQLPETRYRDETLLKLRKALAQLRSIAVYYIEVSSIENVFLLGEKYIRDMKRDLPPLVFQTSIMCIKPTKLKDGFYPSLSDRHRYIANDNAYLELIGFDKPKEDAFDCRCDGDLNKSEPICIAFDYNDKINWMVCGQRKGLKMQVINSFYVKYERKLREIVDDFCKYYKNHQHREVIFYYDSTALGSNYAVNDDDFAAVIQQQFAKNKWECTSVYLGNPMKHNLKYMIMDQAFKGQKYLLPNFNEEKCEALLLAMQMAGARIAGKGFEKDKTGEKYAESETDKLEYRTDATDAFDTLFIGMNFHPHDGCMVHGGSFDILE
jgi:hypothetical protein